MSTARWAQVFVVAAVVAVGGSTPASALPTGSVGCGSELTVDTTLRSDVVGCVGDGLVIGADGITLDLNGHTVSGDTVEDPTEVGIRVAGHHDVHVTNGVVQGFWRGVVFDSSPRGHITAMTARRMTRRGIVVVNGSDGAQIVGNLSADNQASGIAIVTSDGANVVGNRSLRNIGGAGVRLEGATHATVSHNLLNANSFGMQLEDAVGNRLVDNTISGGEMGFEIDASNVNLVDHNRVTGTSTGFGVGGDDNTITDNQVLHGIGPDGIGIQIGGGNRNLVAHNTVIDQIRYGIEVDNFDEVGRPTTDTVVRGNTVNGANEGIAIGPEAGGVVLDTLIEDNRVSSGVDDGIQVLGPSTGLATSTITGNVAVHNGDLGIATVAGTIDGGGNHAAGNGNPLQCINVACH
ncbi:right-handed parallel beta-helix repeat-containing protein [Pedococcus sp. KACC 23699]|uniref:Right-handed parallel beta-helix repeat-containing protein n=1 Tax=Pedococcus sp. KACC 23699 TaxID=3149228 RepID=A0AAU7JUR5_9MICO